MEVKVEIDNTDALFTDPLPSEAEDIVDRVCSYFMKGARFSPAYQKKVWDGKKHLYTKSGKRFPVGLYSEVREALSEIDIKLSPISYRKKPYKQFDVDWEYKHPLRPYQLEAIETSLKAQRGIINVATGGGKTIIALKIFQELGVKSLFIVNTKEALEDTLTRAKECFSGMKNFDKNIGIWTSSTKTIGKMITITTVAAMVAAFKKETNPFINADFQCTFIDEVHHVGSDTWYLMARRINAYYKYGLTGTAFRTDNGTILLQAATGRIIYKITTEELQKKGFLAQSKVTFLKLPEKKLGVYQYDEIYEAGIVDNHLRNTVIASVIKKHKGESILVIVEKVEHGNILLPILQKVDPGAVFVNGKSKNRSEIKKAFEEGVIKTLIATRIYNESADIPIASVLLNAAGGKSGIRVWQIIGRILRLHPSKKEACMYDFIDGTDFLLESHSKERMKFIKKAGHKVEINEDFC